MAGRKTHADPYGLAGGSDLRALVQHDVVVLFARQDDDNADLLPHPSLEHCL